MSPSAPRHLPCEAFAILSQCVLEALERRPAAGEHQTCKLSDARLAPHTNRITMNCFVTCAAHTVHVIELEVPAYERKQDKARVRQEVKGSDWKLASPAVLQAACDDPHAGQAM